MRCSISRQDLRCRLLCAAGCVLVLSLRMAAARGQSVQVTPPQEIENVAFGVVVRISERLFQQSGTDVSETRPVQQMIAGLCNVGTSHVTGTMMPDLRPQSEGVRLDLVFGGTTVTSTVGRERSAVIHSTTTSRFEVTTPVLFDLDSGFRSGTPRTAASMVSACRQADSVLPGLRGSFVRHVARSRMRRREGQIRYESEQATRRRLSEGTAERVEERLDLWNEQWERASLSLLELPGLGPERSVQLASDDEHLLVFISRESTLAADTDAADTDEATGEANPESAPARESLTFPPAELPPATPGGLVDVIIYEHEAQRAVAAVVLAVVEAFLREATADAPIAERRSFDTREGDGWVMLSVAVKE